MDENRAAIAGMLSSAAACLFLAAAIEEEKIEKAKFHKRRCWVKDIRKTRKYGGVKQYLMKELNPNSSDFKNFLRMDEDTFNFILTAIRSDITKKDTFMRKAVSSEEKLAITLRFLATGENFTTLDTNSNLSKAFLSIAIMEVCNAIYKNLKNTFLKFPTTKHQWSKIAENFSINWKFPNCLGALGTKHIAFRPLKTDAPLFVNHKGEHSIVLLGLVDAFEKFIFVDVGYKGSISDDDILQRTNFQCILQQPDKYLPQKRIIGNSRILSHVFVANNAFPLTGNIMTPYVSTTTDESEKHFNYRLNHARKNIDRAFNILSSRFQVLQTTIQLHQTKVKEIVVCCCVLHNILSSRSRWYMEGEINVSEQNDTSKQMGNSNSDLISFEAGKSVRKELAEYFVNEGTI